MNLQIRHPTYPHSTPRIRIPVFEYFNFVVYASVDEGTCRRPLPGLLFTIEIQYNIAVPVAS